MLRILQRYGSLSASKISYHLITPSKCTSFLSVQITKRIVPFTTHCRLISSFKFTNEVEIYEGPLYRKVLMIKILTLSTSFICLPVQMRLLFLQNEVVPSLGMKILLSFTTLFQIVLPLAIHFVAKRYVVRMYYNPETDEYTIVTYAFFPREKYTTFKRSDIRLPSVEVFSTLVIKDKFPIFLDPAHFTDVEHYKKLMGYDKPIDFSNEDTNKVSVEKGSKDEEKPA